MKLLLIVLLSLPAYADMRHSMEIISERRESLAIDPNGCRAKNTCDLQEFSLVEYKKRILLNDDPAIYSMYMTDVRHILATDAVKNLGRYGIIQFVRGCQWHSSWDGKRLGKTLTIAKKHQGRIRPVQYPTWEVDSFTMDPNFTAYNGQAGHMWLWNKDPRSTKPEDATYAGVKPPPHPRVFMTVTPGLSFHSPHEYGGPKSANNGTLEYRTCLFKLEDIPATISNAAGANIDQSKALTCIAWDHKFVFNFATSKMERPVAFDPICLTPKVDLPKGPKLPETSL